MKIFFILNAYEGVKKIINYSDTYEVNNKRITKFAKSWQQEFYILAKKKNKCKITYPSIFTEYFNKKKENYLDFLDKEIRKFKPNIIFSSVNTNDINRIISNNNSEKCKSIIWHSAFINRSDLINLSTKYNYLLTDNSKINTMSNLISFKNFFLMISIPKIKNKKINFQKRKDAIYFSGSLSNKFYYRNKILNFLATYEKIFFRIRYIPENYKILNYLNKWLIIFFPKLTNYLYKKKILPLTNNLKFYNKNEIHGKNLFDEMVNFKFTINCHSDFDNNCAINMRVFESLACGNLLFSDNHISMQNYFINNKHLIYYRNQDDLKNKINYYKSNLNEAEKIAFNGQKLVLNKHNCHIRYKKFEKIIKRINNS